MKLRGKKERKSWVNYCFTAAGVMLVLAAVLYAYLYVRIDREFYTQEDYFGESYSELFALSAPDREVKKSLTEAGQEALQFTGSSEDCAVYGLLSRYCADLELYPTAARSEGEFELLAGKHDETHGYVWMAYSRSIYDAQGSLLESRGTEAARCLSRWTIEKQDGIWRVTEILEPPITE